MAFFLESSKRRACQEDSVLRLLKSVEEDWLRVLFGSPSRGTQLLVYLHLNTAPPGESCLLPSGQLQEGHTGNSEGGMGYLLGQPDKPSQRNPGQS
jgi:hypothetical protein